MSINVIYYILKYEIFCKFPEDKTIARKAIRNHAHHIALNQMHKWKP